MHPCCLPSSLELLFSNRNEEEPVVFPKQEAVSASCQDTVLCVGKLALVVNLLSAS